jgi:hypothetical protein
VYLIQGYEKIVLEENIERLILENMKKDEIIMQIMRDLQQMLGSRTL